jgi:hypothetical protein
MSAENDEQPHAQSRRFTVEDARAKAQEARAKAEFILSRAYGLLREPKKEWEQIRDEVTTIPNILIGYVAPLAALPPLCDLVGKVAFAGGAGLGDVGKAIISAVVAWIVGVAMVYLLGFIIAAIAPNFDSKRDELAAQKVAAYSLTPFFLSTIALLWPPLLWIPILALGAMVFLIYRGVPILMKTPQERAIAYTATIAIGALVTFIVQMALAACVA